VRGVAGRPGDARVREPLRAGRRLTQIHLEGAGAAGGANRAAIGAVVRVTAGGVTRTREVQGGYGVTGQQHDLDLTIGLGEACTIDDLEVRWPDAARTVEHFETYRHATGWSSARARARVRHGVTAAAAAAAERAASSSTGSCAQKTRRSAEWARAS